MLLLEEYLENSGDCPELSVICHSAARLYGSVTLPEMVKAICTYVGTNGTLEGRKMDTTSLIGSTK